MPHQPCPLLGTLDDSNNPGPPVDYPSFENKCMAADDRDMLLLADQATYCLAGGCRLCPRYRAAQAMAAHGRVDAGTAAEVAGGVLASDQLRPELMALAGAEEGVQSRRRWAWMGTAVIFVTVMLCGATFAAWSGWQQVQSFLDEREAGTVQAVANGDVLAPQYIVLTAVAPQVASAAPVAAERVAPAPAEPIVEQNAAAVQPGEINQPQQAFPEAVTATPQQPGAVAPLIVVQPQSSQPQVGAPLPSTEPPNILLEVPTRRATPVFDIPTSTPLLETPTSIPTETPTPTPMGTPVVVFGPAQQLVGKGDCTIISWDVKNVREVYYENQGVDGRGQKEECVDDSLEIYHLVVVLPDGAARTYTTTVTMLIPTNTPQPTPTFTIAPDFTPTWTPLPPTATPTPDINWGVAVNVQGATDQTCLRGAECKIALVVTNTGDVIDNLLVGIVDLGPWSANLCRQDGVCAANNLAVPSMGPGNAANIELRFTIPADAPTNSVRYGVQAVSSGSGGSVSSGTTTVTVTPQ
jgi:hypothetical protein